MTRTRKNPLEVSAPTEDASMKVIRLERPHLVEKKKGRKAALEFPPLPEEIYESMTELEQMHFEFFLAAIQQDNELRRSDYIGLYAAALDWVALLRLQAAQMKSGQLVTMSKQHPGVQLRAWLDTMSFSRRKAGPAKTQSEIGAQLMGLSS